LYCLDIATGRAIWVLAPGTPGNPPGHVLAEGGSYFDPRYSPDGRWIAYTTSISTRQEVYVARAPDLADAIAVSTNGGLRPIWSRDGRELFYREGDAMMRVAVDFGHGLHAAKPERLFSGSFSGESHDVAFDVTRDGQRFIMVKSDEAAALTKLTAVQNWQQDLKR
jgi:Tol biopolymer transport system component